MELRYSPNVYNKGDANILLANIITRLSTIT